MSTNTTQDRFINWSAVYPQYELRMQKIGTAFAARLNSNQEDLELIPLPSAERASRLRQEQALDRNRT